MEAFAWRRNHMEYVEAIQSRKLVLFGAGGQAPGLVMKYFTYDTIECICDNDSRKWGKAIAGIPIRSCESLKGNPDDYVVVITISAYSQIDDIMTQLHDLGIQHVYDSSVLRDLNTFWRYDAELAYNFHELNTFPLVEKAEEYIRHVRSMLHDEKSVYVFDAFVNKLKYNMEDYTDICESWHDHYFSDGILEWEEGEVFVDGGAFDGADTIRFSRIASHRFKKAYVFEPDDNNFVRTNKNLSTAFNVAPSYVDGTSRCDMFELYRAGLYSITKNAEMIRWGNYGSRLVPKEQPKTDSSTLGFAESSAAGVPVVKLDEVISESDKVTFIKLDVEGVEMQALEGARNIIMEHKPKLALSIYHRIEDLWEIPLYIKKLAPEYKLYMRHHSRRLGDKVLFAHI